MCGITGFADWNKYSDETILQTMTNSLQHRGPDSWGLKFFKEDSYVVGLGHSRLAIIDLSTAGHQPMNYKMLWITFNGEIYNYIEIKKELQSLGHNFISHTDTEVVLHAYEEWNDGCLKKFIGMFSFVIYDADNSVLFCARDRAGVKPFFYNDENNRFIFGSELKALVANPYFKKELDYDSVTDFIRLGHVPAPHTIYKNCNKLPAGHFLKIDLIKKQKTIQAYWQAEKFYTQEILDISFFEAKQKTEELLSSACKYRMISDVPVGVFLSGGFDSTCITALLQKESPSQIKTFTIGVENITLNEAPFAKKIAKHLNTEHHELYCSNKDALLLMKEIPFYFDEPFGDQSAIPTMLVSKFARNHVKVAISADGGDELFAGYNKYLYYSRYKNRQEKLPQILSKALGFALSPAVKISDSVRLKKSLSLLKNFSPENYYALTKQELWNSELTRLFKHKTSERNHKNISLKEVNDHWLNYMLVNDYKTYLCDDILQKVDRSSMAFGLEAREPLLDHRLLEWTAVLPEYFKLNKEKTKYILREITHQYVPKKLLDRPKMGFAFPIAKLLRENFQKELEHYFGRERLIAQEIFNQGEVAKHLKIFLDGENKNILTIWNMLMFQMWHEQWME
jgi:asparagine synthase (glutamine-hydrolysing)